MLTRSLGSLTPWLFLEFPLPFGCLLAPPVPTLGRRVFALRNLSFLLNQFHSLVNEAIGVWLCVLEGVIGPIAIIVSPLWVWPKALLFFPFWNTGHNSASYLVFWEQQCVNGLPSMAAFVWEVNRQSAEGSPKLTFFKRLSERTDLFVWWTRDGICLTLLSSVCLCLWAPKWFLLTMSRIRL